MAFNDLTVGSTALSTIFDWHRLIKYQIGAKRGFDVTIPGRPGDYHVTNKLFGSATILIECGLPTSTTATASEALSDFAALFAGQSTVLLKYTDPHKGAIQAAVELLEEPVPSQNRLTYVYALNNPSGVWEDQSASNAVSATPPSVTTSGDRPIGDMVFTVSAVGYIEHTDSLGNANRLTIESGAGGTTPYIIDCGARTVVDSAGTPANKDAYLTVSNEWPIFSPGAAQTLASDVAVEVDWRNKWA